jgi:hypothetical protein
MKITFTKSIQVQENYQFGQIVKPIIESLINPSEANPEEIFNRAKQIYLEEAAKREEPIIEPEPEELEESGALDQAKEELNQEQERGTTFSEDIASEQETTQLSATKLQCGCEFHRGYRDRQARFKENLMKSRNCEGCGRKYNPLDVYACSTIFCSKECGDKAWAKAEGKRLEAENQAKSVPNPAETPERNIIKLKENCSKCNRYKTQKGLYHHLINKHGFDAKTAYDKANEILEAKPASEEVAEEKWDQVLEEKFDFLVTCEYCGHQWLDSCVVMALEHECKYEQERNQARELNNAKSIVEPIIQKTPKELIVVVEATPYAQSFILDREPIEEEPTKELVVIVEPNPQSFIMDQEPAEETLDETPILYQVPAILTRATETLHWLVSNLRL